MISIDDLCVADNEGRRVLDGVHLELAAGQRLAIVGQTGSGKTTLALSLLGAVRPGLRVVGGQVNVARDDVLALAPAGLRRLRRDLVAYVPQDPAASLTPTLRVYRQIGEFAADRSPGAVGRRLAEVDLPDDERFQRRYPHQLSGGQQRRLALARSMARDPRLLVLDEPTAGLDGPVRGRVLDQITRLVETRGMTLVMITHDLHVAARAADRILVLNEGRVEEQGTTSAVLLQPEAAYTRELLAAVPDLSELQQRVLVDDRPGAAPVLRVANLVASYGSRAQRRRVVDDVSFDVAPGECVALLGMSGSGKTTVARCVIGTHVPDSGEVRLGEQALTPDVSRRSIDERRRVQLVPQDSAGSLNPRRRVAATITRVLRVLRGLPAEEAAEETLRLLGLVGLPARLADRFPAELSGGQRQRVTIARALAAGPQVLVCDEMTSSLDVRVQAAVLDLIDGLRRDLQLAVVLITHDLGVVARMADQVVVLHEAKVCEQGRVGDVLGDPQHEWTRELVRAASVNLDVVSRP
ncbi:ABC transporter ATP-binding protein [Catellatospora vulcania]|uniref:ABC transporter ATP-binding protein n=1 Tax=Catellatospora vulcania TaxID=1460450 RepID=UPI0012D46E22|nr:ABC transporter ATP-binding protein [Catellatospora vulcania]